MGCVVDRGLEERNSHKVYPILVLDIEKTLIIVDHLGAKIKSM